MLMNVRGGVVAEISTNTRAYSSLSYVAVRESNFKGLPMALQISLIAFFDHNFRGRDGILIHRGNDDNISLSNVDEGDQCFRTSNLSLNIHGPSAEILTQSVWSWNLKMKKPFSLAWMSNLPDGFHIRSKLSLRWL